MIQDIAPHTYHNEYKPSAPDKNSFILAYEKGSILLPHQNGKQIFIFHVFRIWRKKFQISTASIFICFLSMISVSIWSRNWIPLFFQITNSRIYEIFGQPGHSIWHLQELQDISFSSGTASAGSAAAVENQCCTAKRTYDGMPFLRQSGVPCPVSCSNRRNHKRR